jgi:4-amino-4-deoxy-L-arabinose transferase-like glycosyltransferase
VTDTRPAATPAPDVDAESQPPAPSRRDRRRFAFGVVGVTLFALAVRVTWVLVARRNFPLKGDDYYYHWQANALADGLGFLNPFSWKALGRIDPSAAHPPLYSMYLAVISWFGGTSPLAHRLASCVLGAAAIGVVALVARRIAGERAGIIAGLLGAVYPMLWINDGMLISESMYVLVIALVLLAAYRLWSTRSRLDALFLGATIGLACLTRPEAIMLVPFIGLPFLFLGGGWRPRLLPAFLVALACLVVILPWWVRNLTTFEDPVFLATGHGSVLQIANCDDTYHGALLGYWDINCLTADRPPATAEQRKLQRSTKVPGLVYLIAQDPRDESIPDATARDKALHYIRHHLTRAPIVALARVGRVWGVYRVSQEVSLDTFFERRGKWPSWSGTWMYYGLVALSVYALVVMRKRRVPISPMIAIVAMVTVTAAISIGITRYRVGADVMLVVLGGVGVDALWRRVEARRRGRRPVPHPEGELVAP